MQTTPLAYGVSRGGKQFVCMFNGRKEANKNRGIWKQFLQKVTLHQLRATGLTTPRVRPAQKAGFAGSRHQAFALQVNVWDSRHLSKRDQFIQVHLTSSTAIEEMAKIQANNS